MCESESCSNEEDRYKRLNRRFVGCREDLGEMTLASADSHRSRSRPSRAQSRIRRMHWMGLADWNTVITWTAMVVALWRLYRPVLLENGV